MPARKSQFQTWYEIVKKELLVTEPQNILARSECCQNIINECISHMNMNLGLPALSAQQQYHCAAQPTDHLKFLLDWPGLRVDNSPKAPKTKKEYEKKSKNWLNGRRAPNYGKTLFPFFIHDAERYVLATSKILVKNDEEKQKLYYDIVIYKVLAQLCGCSVSLHEQAKKAPFFCKNSVERKGRLKEILQSYASDHEYIQGFPSCFEEAIGYFDRKSNQYFHQFRSEYLGYDKNYDDDGDSYLEADDLPPRTRGRGGRRGMGMKSSPRDRDRDRYFNKRENRMNQGRQRTGGADAEYWKKQFMNLKRELAKEHQMRIKAERERDNLKNLINTSAANNNMSADIHNIHNGSIGNGSSFGSSNGLPLTNDNSFDSINGSSTTTASTTSSSICGGNGTSNILGDINLPNNNILGAPHNMVNHNINTNMSMPQLQPTNSYQSAQSHSTHHTRSSHSGQTSSGMISNMGHMNINNMNNPSFQINHMRQQQQQQQNNNNAVSNPYGPAIPPIVNNCTNNFNTDMNQLSSLKSNFMLQRSNNQIVNNNNSLQQPLTNNMLPTSINQQNNNINNMMNNNNMMMNNNNVNNNNLNINSINNIPNLNNNKQIQPSLLFQNSATETFGMPATDAFSTIIDTMPIMNRQQQISDDSYPGFGDNSHHDTLTSPAPHSMYSSFNNNNAVVTNTTDPF